MAECIKCRSFNLCPYATPPEVICSQFKPTVQTNADRIRSMSDEELATFFGTLPCCPPGNADELCFPDNTCGADTKMMVKCWGTWLKAPMEDGKNG